MLTVRSQGSPAAALLRVGIALSLVAPGPAWAGQPADPANEWKTEPREEPSAAADVEVAEDAPTAPSRRPKAAGKRRVTGKQKAQAIKVQVEKAESERASLQAQAQALSDAGNLEGAVGLLAGGAEAMRDPVLHLAAADARQKLAQKRGADQAKADWEASVRHCERAEALLAASSAGAIDAVRVDPDETAAMRAWSEQLRAAADGALPDLRRRTNPVRRNARGELIAGSIFLAGGLAGAGVMGGGLYLNAAANQELPKADGHPEYIAPLEAQRKQGETMIAAGAVAGVLGLALGVTLVALGASDFKKARAESLARVRVSPTFGGVHLTARF